MNYCIACGQVSSSGGDKMSEMSSVEVQKPQTRKILLYRRLCASKLKKKKKKKSINLYKITY